MLKIIIFLQWPVYIFASIFLLLLFGPCFFVKNYAVREVPMNGLFICLVGALVVVVMGLAVVYHPSACLGVRMLRSFPLIMLLLSFAHTLLKLLAFCFVAVKFRKKVFA